MVKARPLNKVEFSFYSFGKLNCLFIHIPKTAGVSVIRGLFGHDSFGHIPLSSYYQNLSKEQVNNTYKFCVVRNPFDRLLSGYNYLRSGGRGREIDLNYQSKLSDCLSFEDFVLNWLEKPDIRNMEHFLPQHLFVTDTNGNLMINEVIKFENLHEGIKKVTKALSIKNVNLEKLNVSSKTSQILTKETRDVIVRVYEKDFVLFGYNF